MWAELEAENELLRSELQQVKDKHENRLSELQVHLRDKSQELEDFKQKIIEFTKQQTEAQEKENQRYVNTLKKNISYLNTEMDKLRKKSDEEQLKFTEVLEKWNVEIQSLRAEKEQWQGSGVANVAKTLETVRENAVQLKEYYERRENFIKQEQRKREDKVYEMVLKLKTELDALSQLQFPRFSYPMDPPTKDCWL